MPGRETIKLFFAATGVEHPVGWTFANLKEAYMYVWTHYTILAHTGRRAEGVNVLHKYIQWCNKAGMKNPM